jgi:ubiquinone/menaquinone biosynthesis C-methylase UbiE
MRKYMAPMWGTLLDATRAGAGMRVLDAGCGTGELVALALQRGCHVTGTDLSPKMIELCRHDPELAGAELFEASTEQLPFEDASFDVVISSMSIHFCDDVPRAFRELHRVLKPGGIAGISAPKSPDLQVLIVFKLAAELLPEEARNMELPMMFAGGDALARQLVHTGFQDVTERVAECPMIADTFEELWEAEKTWAPVHRACERVGEEAFLRVYQERMRLLTGIAAPTHLDLAYRVATAVKAR